MANPYADDLRTLEPTQTAPGGKNPYADDIKEKGEATLSSVAHNTTAGLNEGIAKTLGYPADLVGGFVNQAAGGVNYLAGRKVLADNVQPFGGSESIRRGLNAIGADTADTVEANHPIERIARGAGEGAGGMAAGGGMVGGAKSVAGTAAPKLFSVMEGLFGANPTTAAATGAIQGAAAEAAGEVAPDGYKTGARIVGGLVGGAVPVASHVAYEGGKFAVRAAQDFARPFTKAGQESLAGERIANAATDVHAVRDSLENGPHELVPGSKPTTFQQTGDMGLGQLERQVRTNNPDDFLQRASEQNAARSRVIQGTQATGSPADVSAHFRGLRDSLDRVTETAINHATQQRNQSVAAMGGNGSAEGYGAAMREPAQVARDAAKEAERTLWRAVDPHGDLVMPATPIASSARNIEGQLSRSARPMSGEEREIFDIAGTYDERTPFREVRDLRGRISAAMSEELRNSGRTPTYARLVQLRQTVERTIDRAVENQARMEQSAVARGQMSAEDTMAARFAAQRDEFLARRNSQQANNSAGDRANSGSRSSGVSGSVRTNGEAGGPLGLAPGDQGIQGTPLDAAAAQRLRDASAATRQRATTFDEGATGAVLKTGSRAGEYRTPDSLVPSKVFHPGANGGEDVRHYINAVGHDQAVPVIADYAAFSLRRAAMRPDGSIDTAKALAWAKQHDAALAELPPEVRSRLANPGRAEEAVTRAADARKEQLANFDRSAVAHVMGADSGDVVRQVGSIFNSRDAAARMQELATAARGNPSAQAGLRRAVVDHIQSQFLSNTEAATTGANQIKADAFQTFMRTKADVLAKVFTPEEIGALRAVAQDLQRANRSINATKLPGGSNTAQDTAHRVGEPGTILNKIAVEAAAAAAGHAAAGASGGIAGWLGTKVASALRDAGLANVDNLVKEAMLNPELARALLQKVPAKPDTGAALKIVKTVKRMAVSGPVIGATQSNRQEP